MAEDIRFDEIIDAHREQLEKLAADSTTTMDAANAEPRDLTLEESDGIKANSAEFDRIKGLIQVREAVLAQNEELNRPLGRLTEPENLPTDPEADPVVDPEAPPAPARPRAQGRPLSKVFGERSRLSKTHGFHAFGEFVMAVKNAGMRGGDIDNRLMAAAASTYGNESSGTDGGFAIPPDFRAVIEEKAFGEDSLIARTDRQVVTGNSLTFPTDMTTPWSGGITAYWTGEAAAVTQSKPVLQETNVRLHKLSVLVPMTDELLDDSVAMGSYVARKAGEKIDYKVSDAIVNGNGVGQPLGFRNSAVMIEQAAETSQVADTIVAGNIVKMMSRLPSQSRRTAIWLIHPDAEPQLPLMTISNQPVYMPPGGLSGAMYGTLLGRPVIPHQVCQTVGDDGDIMLVDLSQYLTVTKAGGVRSQTSIHLWFDQGITAFRFDLRVAGQPWWSEVTTADNGSFTQSPFIEMADR